MPLALESRLRAAVAAHLEKTYGLGPEQLPSLVVEAPPRPELGEFALPVCFELAKRLRRAPRQIAQEIAAAMGAALPSGFARVSAEGGGYLNFHVDRAAAAAAGFATAATPISGKVIVEHTNINPNKAAHIGHLRNAVLGDTWVRILRALGGHVEVQNLQDNTGVQVADVVAAFLHLEGDGDAARALGRVRAAIADPRLRFDYLCWDLYAAISQHYERNAEALAAWRGPTLQAIEAGGNPVAELAEAISTAIAERHLRTMERIGVAYDVLPRESEILHRQLWHYAFRQLQERGAVRLEENGKNAGCWVMDRAEEGEEDSKVIVRSNGTVTYVGKDIAYQLWKFGLLPLEFDYVRFHHYPEGGWAWRTAMQGEQDAPAFGKGKAVYNVIDARQSYLQDIVVAGLRALGYAEQAGHSVHFSYEMVALSAACATELGFAASPEDKRVDVSGRKGTGVKADDLLDRLLERTRVEVEQRNPELSPAEREQAANRIAVGALRYFLLKFARTTTITFDFKEALNFEGETGPYVQYAAVRAASILRKAGANAPAVGAEWAPWLEEPETWNLLWTAHRLDSVIEQAYQAQEPAFLTKYAFQLAQTFNSFYHHTPILPEPDPGRRTFLLWTVAQIEATLQRAMHLMGMSAPAVM